MQKILKFFAGFVFLFVISFWSQSVLADVGPAVSLSYSSNPAGLGANTITATYSEPISGAPTISINQPGTIDISNAPTVSTSGVGWIPQTGVVGSWLSVVYANGLFLASSGGGEIMTSPDGITWTAISAPGSVYSITYGNNTFVAVGYHSVMTSPDGITWTAQTAAEANVWHSATYGNGLFVVVSIDGTHQVMTSPDGITWTARTAPEANGWYSVTYGNDLFVAVATDGTHRIMTSPDGITWTVQTATELNLWVSVAYGNGAFVAISADGANRAMTYFPNVYTYDYTVHQASGTNYVNGTATVSLSSTTDLAGNTSNLPTNNTFAIDAGLAVTAPSTLSYTTPNIFTKDSAITPLSPTVTGTVTSYSVSPSLPTGLSLDTTTGIIS